MDKNKYRSAIDSVAFSEDFQVQTANMLTQYARAELGKEQKIMKFKSIRKIAVAALAAIALSISAYAAVMYLSPAEVAEHGSDVLLAEAFKSSDAKIINERTEAGDFTLTLLGLVSGAGISDYEPNVDEGHTYAALAVEYTDGTPISEPLSLSEYTFTPFVAGFNPWAVNNWTLNSSISAFTQDGVMYYLLDTQNLEMFADHTVYFAFYKGSLPSRESFTISENGDISFSESFTEPHALFVLPLDESKADPTAVESFIADSGFDRDYFFPGVNPANEPYVSDSSTVLDSDNGDESDDARIGYYSFTE